MKSLNRLQYMYNMYTYILVSRLEKDIFFTPPVSIYVSSVNTTYFEAILHTALSIPINRVF